MTTTMERDAIETRQVGAYRVHVVYDDDGSASDPRENSNLGTFAGSSRHSTVYEERAESAAAAWRMARSTYGPLIALPIRVWDGSMGSSAEVVEWTDADGIYYVPMKKVREEWSSDRGYGLVDAIHAARACLIGELKEWTQWAQGEVYGFVVEDERGESVDSCYGFIGEDDYAMSEGVDVAEWLEGRRWESWAGLPEWVRGQVLAWQEEEG